MATSRSLRVHLVMAFAAATLTSCGLYLFYAWRNRAFSYNFLPFNLVLAWLPLLLAFRLKTVLRHKLWSSWEALVVSLLWLVFLPNSFYMISDFIHLQAASANDVLYLAAAFMSFIFTAVFLGFSSLYLVHFELMRRLSARWAIAVVGGILLSCSLAIYIGRDLRWNSWDLLVNPSGLLFDLSDRLLHPQTYGEIALTVITFFVLLASLYGLVWYGARLLRHSADPA